MKKTSDVKGNQKEKDLRIGNEVFNLNIIELTHWKNKIEYG